MMNVVRGWRLIDNAGDPPGTEVPRVCETCAEWCRTSDATGLCMRPARWQDMGTTVTDYYTPCLTGNWKES